MRDYKLGKIYKLHILGNDELIYYGSTIQTLGARLAGHRKDFKRWKNGKGNYTTSFKLFENGEVVITLVEKYACSCKYELEAKERFYIENNKCVNTCIPTRTMKEYEKSDKRKQYLKEYRKTDKYKQYKKEWFEANANKYKTYHKEYQKTDKYKQYRKKNANKIKEYQNKYQKEYNKEKVKCEFCGCYIRKDGLKKHKKRIKCKKFQNTISSQ